GGPVPEGLATSVAGISVGLLGAAIVLVFMPAIEPLLGKTSNLTIAGLLRLDHPVLLWLRENAPGTYHHSLNVGALAAAAARRTGANPLLAQAGGHFHDLGKVNKPAFFMENIRDKNPHDDISPAESAKIILAHATDGFEIARKKGLPPEVAAITREHQGTTLVEWFYKKATELGEDVRESDFRYAGPKPQSKEAALVMLADAVEAISRTLDSPDRSSLARAIDYILEKKRVEGQLEDSAIRSSHLPEIREAFLESLLDIHHRRVKYPGNPTEPGDTPGPVSPETSQGDTSR
ncbi:MAG: HD domain-containing protein, partial [Planctomycetota bacterium]|nr:HD domain-containing protein [Planctomycetota bacterium]